MKHTVTFCVFDHTVGGNPFWHGSFFLSKLDESKQLLEVVETWGFYGVTSTGDKSSRLEQFKIKNHLDVDFQGNHGMLIHEEVRFMDLGHGLHGYTFELTQYQFAQLQKRCADAVAEQEAAIREIVGDGQNFKTDPARKGRVYKEEAYSRQIFEIEQIKAKIEGRPSRLKPFDFHLSFGLWGPSLKNSNTCKTRAVALLEGILTEEQLAPFKNSSFPRMIQGLESILLHSEGPLRIHTRASGKEIFYRDQKLDKEVKLYWSVPPQYFDALSEETVNLFEIDEDYREEVKYLVSQLQRLEWVIRNASLPRQYQKHKEELIQQIIACYKAFAQIEPKSETKINGWHGSFLFLLSLPRSKEEKKLQGKIQHAKTLLNSLYMAIVDNWTFDEDFETSSGEEDTPETLVSYLPREEKKKICKIMGRSYLENDEEADVTPRALVPAR